LQFFSGMPLSLRSARGLSLVEVVVATAVLVTALAGAAQLLTSSSRFLLDAERGDTALTAAQAQLEWLRSRAWTYDGSGMPVSDPALAPSPPGSLDADAAGYSEYLDRSGRPVDRVLESPVFRRRWSITAVDGGEPDALAIEVCVSGVGAASATPAEVCLMTVRTRQP
jgi:type II secretory pathway pseudopilin PulG